MKVKRKKGCKNAEIRNRKAIAFAFAPKPGKPVFGRGHGVRRIS